MEKKYSRQLRELSELIDRIYQSAMAFTSWNEVVADITNWIGATRTLLFTPFHTPAQGGFLVTHNAPTGFLEQWATKYVHQDIWAQRAKQRGLMKNDTVVLDQQLVTDEEFLSSEIYREFLGPNNAGRLMGGVIFGLEDNHGVPVACSVHRPHNNPFVDEDVTKLRMLLPHMSRALGTMFHLRDADYRVATSLAALDRLPHGVLLLRADGTVAFTNRAATKMLASDDGLRLRTTGEGIGELVTLDPQQQRLLDEAIRHTIAPDAKVTQHFSHALRLARPSGSAFLVHMSRLGPNIEFGLDHGTPRAIAFLTEETSALRPNAALLQSGFRLTQAEVRTANAVALGLTNEAAATQLGVSVNTVKTHLRSVYHKTNTANRAALIKLLLTLSIEQD